MNTRYVTKTSTASVEFAEMIIDLQWELPEGADADMMRFLYGNGQ